MPPFRHRRNTTTPRGWTNDQVGNPTPSPHQRPPCRRHHRPRQRLQWPRREAGDLPVQGDLGAMVGGEVHEAAGGEVGAGEGFGVERPAHAAEAGVEEALRRGQGMRGQARRGGPVTGSSQFRAVLLLAVGSGPVFPAPAFGAWWLRRLFARGAVWRILVGVRAAGGAGTAGVRGLGGRKGRACISPSISGRPIWTRLPG